MAPREYNFLRHSVFYFLLSPLILAVLVYVVSCPDVLQCLCFFFPVVSRYNDYVVPYALQCLCFVVPRRVTTCCVVPRRVLMCAVLQCLFFFCFVDGAS